MAEENKKILNFLKEKIDTWLSAREGRNLSILARRTNHSYSFIWRLYNQDTVVNAQKITPVLDEICTAGEIIEFYKQHFKDLGEIATRAYNAAINYQKANLEEARPAGELKEYLKDPAYFHLIALCASGKGIPRASITAQLGISSEQLIEELLEKNILVMDSSERIKLEGHVFFADRKTILNGIKNSCDVFLKRKNGVHATIEVNSFNIESIRKIENKIQEVNNLIQEMNITGEAKGDIPFSYCAALGRIDFLSEDNVTDTTGRGTK